MIVRSAWFVLGLAGLFEIGWAVGLKYFREPATLARLVCIGLILTGIIGLKLLTRPA